jgi:hypothetical protein
MQIMVPRDLTLSARASVSNSLEEARLRRLLSALTCRMQGFCDVVVPLVLSVDGDNADGARAPATALFGQLRSPLVLDLSHGRHDRRGERRRGRSRDRPRDRPRERSRERERSRTPLPVRGGSPFPARGRSPSPARGLRRSYHFSPPSPAYSPSSPAYSPTSPAYSPSSDNSPARSSAGYSQALMAARGSLSPPPPRYSRSRSRSRSRSPSMRRWGTRDTSSESSRSSRSRHDEEDGGRGHAPVGMGRSPQRPQSPSSYRLPGVGDPFRFSYQRPLPPNSYQDPFGPFPPPPGLHSPARRRPPPSRDEVERFLTAMDPEHRRLPTLESWGQRDYGDRGPRLWTADGLSARGVRSGGMYRPPPIPPPPLYGSAPLPPPPPPPLPPPSDGWLALASSPGATAWEGDVDDRIFDADSLGFGGPRGPGQP